MRYGERLGGSLSASWRGEEDGSLSGTFRLPPLQGAVLLKALRAACANLAGDPRAGVSAETRPPRRRCPVTRRVDLHHIQHWINGGPFYRPDGSLLPSSPPPWYGERLDLNHAIWACFANARTDEENKPTGSRPKSRSSDRTHGAVTSATRPTTSAVFTTNTRPPDNPALYACFAISPTLEDGTE